MHYSSSSSRCSHSVMSDSTVSWTLAHQAPLSMEILQARILSRLPCPPPGYLPDPGIEPWSPALQAEFFFCLFVFYCWATRGNPLAKMTMTWSLEYVDVTFYSKRGSVGEIKLSISIGRQPWITGVGLQCKDKNAYQKSEKDKATLEGRGWNRLEPYGQGTLVAWETWKHVCVDWKI